jgi:hypothetical protein
MQCYHCGLSGALIETHAPGYGRHFWHQSCLASWRKFTAGSRPAPQRYLWEPSFDFETPLIIVNKLITIKPRSLYPPPPRNVV